MVTYRFRISFEDYDDVMREIDIKTTQTFADLHRALHKATGYNSDKSSSFYVSTDNWMKGDEIAFLPSEKKIDRGVQLMEDSKIKAFIEDPHQKFYYTYDFDRPYDFHVELIKIILDADESIEYPFLFKSVGEAPKIIEKGNLGKVAVAAASTSDFDFFNEMNFVPEDADELESLAGTGINEEEQEEDEEENDDFANEEDDAYGNEGDESDSDY